MLHARVHIKRRKNRGLAGAAFHLVFGEGGGPAAVGRAVSISCVFLSVKSRAQRLFPAGTNGRGKTICEWHKKHPGGLLVAACRGGVRFMTVFVIETAVFVIMGSLFVIGGRVKRKRLALAGHALGAGLEHIRLDALPEALAAARMA